MTKNELKLIAAFLREYGDRLSNDGCNDYYLENTPENFALVKEAETEMESEPQLHKGQIITFNHVIVDHLASKIEKELDG